MKNYPKVLILVLTLMHFAAAVAVSEEPWQVKMKVQLSSLQPGILDRHRGQYKPSQISSWLANLMSEDPRKCREALDRFYELREPKVMALAMKQPSERIRAATYLEAIGTPDVVHDLYEALRDAAVPPLIGSENVTENIKFKAAVLRALSNITGLDLKGVDVAHYDEGTMNAVLHAIRDWEIQQEQKHESGSMP